MQELVKNLDQLDALMPQLLTQFPQMIATMQSTRTMMLTMHSTMSGIFAQMDDGNQDPTAMGKDFDAAKNDDSFYLPPEVFKNQDFQRIMKIFLSPDGKAARMLISQRGDPATPEGISRVDPIRTAAEEALKGTPLENAKIYVAGTAAMVKDLVDGIQIRSLDRGSRCALPYFHHHAHHDAKLCRRPGYRRYGGAFAGRVLRAVRARLAVYSRHTNTLDGVGDVRDPPFGGRV